MQGKSTLALVALLMIAQTNSFRERFRTVSENTEPNTLVLVIKTKVVLLVHHIVHLMMALDNVQ